MPHTRIESGDTEDKFLQAEQHIRDLLASGQLTAAVASTELMRIYEANGFKTANARELANQVANAWASGEVSGMFSQLPGSPVAGAVDPGTGAVDPDTGAVDPGTGAVDPDTGTVVGDEATTRLEDLLQRRRDMSETRQGRAGLFKEFAAGSPFVQRLNPFGREQFNRQLDPLSAQFVLQQIGEQQQEFAPDFRSFIGDRPNPLSSAGFQSALEPLRTLFAPGLDPTTLSEAQRGTRERLEEDPWVARNVIGQALGSRVNPFIRRLIPGIVSRRADAFRDVNPDAELFEEFVRRNFQSAPSGQPFGGF
jgi:hypothetical protein